MGKYTVYAEQVVSTVTYVEADSAEEAEELQYQEGWTGLMFLDHNYPDEGEWEIKEVWEQED